MTVEILQGDCLEVLRTLPAESVNCCVTSPPYWGLRDYGCDGQIGMEPTPLEFVEKLANVFDEVNRVVASDGTLWLNLGDSYAGSWGAMSYPGGSIAGRRFGGDNAENVGRPVNSRLVDGLKAKDLVGVPWQVALELRRRGWYLRQDIIWHKPNPMPESVQDRCTKAHEYIFLLAKSERYYFNSEAIQEASVTNDVRRPYGSQGAWEIDGRDEDKRPNGKPRKGRAGVNAFRGQGHFRDGAGPANRAGREMRDIGAGETRNKRSVWTVTTKPYKGAHFATFPPDLIKPCILAGCPEGGTVLDPFFGSGTTGQVATECGCNCIGIELNAEYVKLAKRRNQQRSLLA